MLQPDFMQFIGIDGESPELTQLCHECGKVERHNYDFDGSGENTLILREVGLQITLNRENQVIVVFLFSAVVPGYQPCPFPLPRGFSFDMGQDAVRRLLGNPSKSGGPIATLDGTSHFYWDRWDDVDVSVHLQYPPNRANIEKVTIMRADRVPG